MILNDHRTIVYLTEQKRHGRSPDLYLGSDEDYPAPTNKNKGKVGNIKMHLIKTHMLCTTHKHHITKIILIGSSVISSS